jgi:quinolinate synthase
MAETADILANRPEKLAERGGERVTVILPDMAAGCSMADMAAIEQVEDAWDQLGEVIDTDDLTPVTYINSAPSLKAFCGRHGGIVCTSSNARAVLEWAFARGEPRAVLPRPAPGPQHGARWASARPDAGLGPVRRRAGRQHEEQRSTAA